MIRNYLKTALRGFLRHRIFTLINIAGLVTGLASCLVIFLWINDEVGIDGFHEKDSRLYQMFRNQHLADGQISTTPAVPEPVKGMLDNEYPEVDQSCIYSWENEILIQYEKISFKESGRYASPEFFDMFSYEWLEGDLNTAFQDIHSIAISDKLAAKLFQLDEDELDKSIGKTFNVDNRQDFKVTGVFSSPESNSTLQFDWVIPSKEYISRNDWVENWGNGGFRLYFTLREDADPNTFQSKVEMEVNNHRESHEDERLFFQKFSDTYLYSNYENGVVAGGRIDYVNILTIVGAFILIIACINFMNLSTAQSSRRAKEIGVRKVLGARKKGLSLQFITEAVLLTLISTVIAGLVVILFLPYFNTLTAKQIVIDFNSVGLWGSILSISLVSGLLAGSYPAFILPALNTLNILKGGLKHTGSSVYFRKGLVIFQFSISIILILGTLTVSNQIQYIMNKNLGLNRDNLVFIPLESNTSNNFDSYKTELLKLSGVTDVTTTSGNPLSYGRSSGSPTWPGKDPDAAIEFNILMTDHDFVETMEVELLAGRNFSEIYSVDSANYIINEESARIMGFDDPIDQSLRVWGVDGKIVGVIKNFHMTSMYEEVAPLIIRYDPPTTGLAFVRIEGNPQPTLVSIEELTAGFNPDVPFSYQFLDESYEAMYVGEKVLSSLSYMFAGIAILISALGLLGLSSFSAEQRRKEIGIRKVHGASVARLIITLSKEYTNLILIAFVIAAPIGYYFGSDWLDNFAYRTELNLFTIFSAGLGAVLIAGLTVGIRSFQAASANPTKTLKAE